MQNRRHAVNPLGHVHVAASQEHNDRVLVDCADLPDEFVLSARQLERPVRTLALGFWIEAYTNNYCVSLRGKGLGVTANGSLSSCYTETNDGTPNCFKIFEADLIRLARFQMSAIAVDCLGMALPVVDHSVVANV